MAHLKSTNTLQFNSFVGIDHFDCLMLNVSGSIETCDDKSGSNVMCEKSLVRFYFLFVQNGWR